MLQVWIQLDGRATPDHLGFIPSFLDESDPRPVREQFDDRYGHGGGWRPQGEWKMKDRDVVIQYPGDPPLSPLFAGRVHNEVILVYAHGIVAIVQPDMSYEIARMD